MASGPPSTSSVKGLNLETGNAADGSEVSSRKLWRKPTAGTIGFWAARLSDQMFAPPNLCLNNELLGRSV